ncbi:MAG: class II aldolase/adducin family protein [Deferribacteres bacterium]|nr:class II aldolase/adducin family protein [candidate division KSB1 bacterium]MCB9501592.1 class II aldolase/adducin family protein [Deferribacteres bacterium]
MNRIYNNKMTTLSGGNLSIKDLNGDIWITPAGIDKGKLTPGDIMCVKADGTIEGKHRPSSEFPFHKSIYKKRADINAIVHAHPPALVSFSIVRQIPDTNIIPQAKRVCGMVGYAPYALPGSEQLGENIAATFAKGFNVVLLENHGVATGGSDLLNAFHRLETLEFCARTIMQARRIGDITTLTEEQISFFDHRRNHLPEFELAEHTSVERELRSQIVDIVHRACDRGLMISTEGVASARIDDTSFLITPSGLGRRSIDIEDIVLIRDGMREMGKNPSRSVLLHQAIYKKHPAIRSIITAQSPGVTAYAISEQFFETRTIPESYVVLRDIPKIVYGKQYNEPEEVANSLSDIINVLLIQNDCLLTTGKSSLEAFDRLEVAEFSANSLIASKDIGECVKIGNQEIADLNEKFFG